MTSYDDSVLSDSPWGYWRQLETSGNVLADSSGNARPLTITGSPTLAQLGPDGVLADAIAWPDAATTACYAATVATMTTSPATAEAWVYLTAIPSTAITLVGGATAQGSSTTDKTLFIDTAGRPAWYPNGAANIVTGASPLALNTWHHVIGSTGPSGSKVRVDKVTVGTGAPTSTNLVAQKIFVHGGGNAGGDRSKGGPCKIARPAFYTAQLADLRTDAHYDALTATGPAALSGVWGLVS